MKLDKLNFRVSTYIHTHAFLCTLRLWEAYMILKVYMIPKCLFLQRLLSTAVTCSTVGLFADDTENKVTYRTNCHVVALFQNDSRSTGVPWTVNHI